MKKQITTIMASSIIKLVIPVIAMFSFSLPVSAETFSGKLIGYGCAKAGTTCPVDNLDPHLRFEPDFVLLTDTGQYYLMPNINRDIKIHHVLETVQVEGDKDKRYDAITVNEFRVKQGAGYKTIWSRELEERARKFIDDQTNTNS